MESLKSKATSFDVAVQSALFSDTSFRNIIDASVERSIAPAVERLTDTLISGFSDMLSAKVTNTLVSIARTTPKTVVDLLPHDEEISSSVLTPANHPSLSDQFSSGTQGKIDFV